MPRRHGPAPPGSTPARTSSLRVVAVPVLLAVLALIATHVAVGETVSDLRAAGPGYTMLLAAVLVATLLPVLTPMRREVHGVRLAMAFVVAAMLRWGLVPALPALLLAGLTGVALDRRGGIRAVNDLAISVVATTVAWGVLVAGGWSASVAAPAVIRPADLPLLAAAATVFHLVQVALHGLEARLRGRPGLHAALNEALGTHLLTTVAVLAVSPLMVVVLEVHWGLLPLSFLPLLTLWATASLSLDRERRALTDPLTGLANREQLRRQLRERLTRPHPSADLHALVLLDLHRFRDVNATFGHEVGDQLLRAVAGRLERAVRDVDVVARLGSDEFVLVVELDAPAAAAAMVHRITERLTEPYELGGLRVEIELSAGVALVPDDGRSLDELVRRADAARDAAAAAGELVAVYRSEHEHGTPSRVTLLTELKQACRDGQLELYFQPQVCAVGDALFGMEALLRWHHPVHGVLLPGRFLPAAEHTALMREITAVVLAKALEQTAAWMDAGLEVAVAINASLHDLADEAFAERVSAGLALAGVPPRLLRLEITEQALVSDPARVGATLERLRKLGIVLSLDDFGTGHASLTRLKHLPVGEVKIDRDFVAELGDGRVEDIAMVRAIVQLACALGLRSVAEGVETEVQRAIVAELGCDAVQGWHLAHPMTGDDATRWLRTRHDAGVAVEA